MKKSRTTKTWQTRRGFTLIEILTVLVIILVLAGLLLPAIQRSIIKAEQAKAKDAISQLSGAMNAYMMEFGRWPTNPASGNGILPSFAITTGLWNNANNIVFYTASPKDTGVSNTTYNGCVLDPWGTPYYCILDTSYTGGLVDPCSGVTITKGFAIWSTGPDGQATVTTGSTVPPCSSTTSPSGLDADNITSW